jgi:hypothetical protein
MLALVPRPVKAVLLLFPIEKAGELLREEEDKRIGKEGQPKIDDTLFWVKQKVCGLLSILQKVFSNSIDSERVWDHWTYSCYSECTFFDIAHLSAIVVQIAIHRPGFNSRPRAPFKSSYSNPKVSHSSAP